MHAAFIRSPYAHAKIVRVDLSKAKAQRGVLGAFLVLRPHAQIVTLFPLVVYWAMAEIRAALFLPVWFTMQFFNGFLSLAAAQRTQEAAGVAWWAHIGGFLFGVVVGAAIRWRQKKTNLESSKFEVRMKN